MKKSLTFLPALLCLQVHAQTGPEITSWILNQGEMARYYVSGNTNPITMSAQANVQYVGYNATDVYIECTGLPGYVVGPFLDGNPSLAGNADYEFRIPRNPQQNTGTLTEPGLGQIGVWINGVPIYNYADAMSYNNQGIWHRNAVTNELDGFDCSKGHPAPNMQNLNNSFYHHHQNPITFASASGTPLSNVCSTYPSDALYTVSTSAHSPLIGYAFDGYPVYGPYAYANTNGTGGIVRMESSFQLRNITQRTTLPDGTVLQPSQYGPAVDATYPLGTYKEDFEFVSGLGDLDEHNGRFCVTPEYPLGIYCYFATVDADHNSAYPYVIGETYYGVVATDNLPAGPNGNSVVIPGGLTQYTGATSADAEFLRHNFQLYPNPAAGEATLWLSNEMSGISLSLKNLQGQEVLHIMQIEQGANALDLTKLPAGLYLLSLQKGNAVHTLKLSHQ